MSGGDAAQGGGGRRELLPFSEYMQRCLYGPDGYYHTGRVRFGTGAHFWTWPQRLRPAFGELVAERVLRLLRRLLRSGRVPPAARLTVLELGAGDGALGADLLGHVARSTGVPRWAGVAERVRYVSGEASPALRERQRSVLAPWISTGWAEVRSLDATELLWDGPFWGVVVANELLDALPCERLRVSGVGLVERTHVLLTPEAEAGAAASERLTPLTEGWRDARGRPGGVPDALQEYLRGLEPTIEALAARRQLPAWVHWAPGVDRLLCGLSELLDGPDRLGAALLVDYGGSSQQVLDPTSADGHLRAYGATPQRAARGLPDASPYLAPGRQDLTWDVDFTHVVERARRRGLRCAFYGRQARLEQPPGSLDAWPSAARLLDGRVAEGVAPTWRAAGATEELVQRFREDTSFHVVILEPNTLPADQAATGLGAGEAL